MLKCVVDGPIDGTLGSKCNVITQLWTILTSLDLEQSLTLRRTLDPTTRNSMSGSFTDTIPGTVAGTTSGGGRNSSVLLGPSFSPHLSRNTSINSIGFSLLFFFVLALQVCVLRFHHKHHHVYW